MDTINDQYFNWLCRTCMQEIVETKFANEGLQQRQWQSIFDVAEECDGPLSIAELLSDAIPQIEVNLEDNLSKKMCNACVQELTSMHRFQQMCIQSDREMREKIAIIYMNLSRAESDVPAEEQALHLPKEQRISLSDPLESVDGAIETHDDSQEDDSDKYIATDNHEETLLSTINVKEELVTVTAMESIIHNCALCNKKFKESRLLKRHLKRHARSREKMNKEMPMVHEGTTEQKMRTCKVCQKTFSTRYKLRVHKEKEHPTEKTKKRKLEKEYSCEVCNKISEKSPLLKIGVRSFYSVADDYKNIDALKNHTSKHTDARPFLCPECGKTFLNASALEIHRVRHSDVKPFECPLCPARFHTNGNLKKHKITHEAIKRHICDICGKRCGQSYELKAHKKYHTGEKPFKCDFCEMRFVRRSNQRRHMLTHTGEKPYKCKYCERAFAQTNDHVKHLRTHLGDNVYGCTLCPSAFRLASERRAHFVTHKNDDEETRERNMKALKDREAKLQIKID